MKTQRKKLTSITILYPLIILGVKLHMFFAHVLSLDEPKPAWDRNRKHVPICELFTVNGQTIGLYNECRKTACTRTNRQYLQNMLFILSCSMCE